MRPRKSILFTIFALSTLSLSAQQESRFERRTDSEDDSSIREFVESKENIGVQKKASNLQISGDVRFVWQNQHEKGVAIYASDKPESSDKPSGLKNTADEAQKNNQTNDNTPAPAVTKPKPDDSLKDRFSNLRGYGRVGIDDVPIAFNDYKVKFNLKFKYDFDQTWAMAQLQFNNLAGISSFNQCSGNFPVFSKNGQYVVSRLETDRAYGGQGSGFGGSLNLRRAYIGHTLFADGKQRLDFEIGRRQLDDVFMSEIQFSNYLDGVIFEYASDINQLSDFYLTAAAFIVDQRTSHYAYAIETGLLNIFDSNFDLRYSFIDWQRKDKNRCFVDDPIGNQFKISQFTLAYQVTPTICGYALPTELYGAFLVNTAAQKNIFTNNKRANLGWYLDIYVGNVLKKGDWSFEFIYTAAQAQVVPDYDCCGVGRGNILNTRLTDFIVEKKVKTSLTDKSSDKSSDKNYYIRQGNANYQGCLFDFLYAVTDNFSVDISYEFSYALDKEIGGDHRFHNFEMEFLYAF